MKKILFKSLILKLENDTYYVTNLISNYLDYKEGNIYEIDGKKGKFVGFGLRIYVMKVLE